MKGFLNGWILVYGLIGYSLVSLGSDVPELRNVKMTQSQNRLVTITYEIATNPAIITVDIQTNGVSIGAENFRNIAGDVNRVVGIGPHVITWEPEKSWLGHKVENARAMVCAWPLSSPPDYMAVDLKVGSRENVRWYTGTNALPEELGSDLYRGNILLMRRIYQPRGGEWVMGSPQDEVGRSPGETVVYHRVTLTNDYWMGVFEVTQKQWKLIKNTSPFGDKGDFRPAEQVSYDMIRGRTPDSYYPAMPSADSFLSLLCERTGIGSFDLPSEMQWEYACRAGTGTALNNGTNLTVPWGKDPELDKLGKYDDRESEQGHVRVGSFQPNQWGLYDMHGNVWEWCLDWHTDDITGLNGAVYTGPGTQRVVRGGSSKNSPAHCRSGCRSSKATDVQFNSIGFRLVCGLEL